MSVNVKQNQYKAVAKALWSAVPVDPVAPIRVCKLSVAIDRAMVPKGILTFKTLQDKLFVSLQLLPVSQILHIKSVKEPVQRP